MKKRHIPISENMFNGELVQAKCYCGKVITDKTELVWAGGIEIRIFRKYEDKDIPDSNVKLENICGNCFRKKYKEPYNYGINNWNRVINKKTPVKYISQVLNISIGTAKIIKEIVITNELGFVLRLLGKDRMDFGSGSGVNYSIKMELIDKILRGFGIEAIILPNIWIDNYWMDNCGIYVNTGETYSMTILFDTDKKEFICTSWGDFYETLESRLKIR
jgi:hypothetical protein